MAKTKTTLPDPLYAVAGAGDLLAEQVKKIAANAPEIQTQVQKMAADLPADLRKIGKEIPADLQNFAADLPSYAAQARVKARSLDADQVTTAVRKNVQTARKNVETASVKAQDLYTTLVKRGHKVVDGKPVTLVVKPAPATKPTAKQSESDTVAKKTAARTTAKKVATKSATRPGTTSQS